MGRRVAACEDAEVLLVERITGIVGLRLRSLMGLTGRRVLLRI